MTTNNTFRNIVFIVALLISSITFAQIEQKEHINYQGIARDASNEVIAAQTITIGVSLRFGSPTATVSYAEDHSVTTDVNGVFSLQIGTGTVVNGNYNNLEWGYLAPFASISLNGTQVGTVQLQSVPYANASGKATRMKINDLTDVGGIPSNGQVLKFDGTNWTPATDETVTGGSTLWTENGDDIYYDTGKVSIGSVEGQSSRLSVVNVDPETRRGVAVDVTNTDINSMEGVRSVVGLQSSGAGTGFLTKIYGAGTGSKTGFESDFTASGEGTQYGFKASFLASNPSTKYGFYVEGEDYNYFSGGVSIGKIPDLYSSKLHVEVTETDIIADGESSSTISSENNYSGNSVVLGIHSSVTGIGSGLKVGVSSIVNNGIGPKYGYRSIINMNESQVTGVGPSIGLWSLITNNSSVPSVGLYAETRLSTGTGSNYGVYTKGEDSNYFSGNVGIGRENPDTQLDISGGQWDLNNTEGDFRIGNDTYRLKIGMSLGGGGAGRAHIRAQGGINEISLGAGNTEVLKIKEDAVVVDGEVNRPSTGDANMIPIAYGMGGEDISVPNGTNNFSVSGYINIDNSARSYKITINGESINYNTHIVMVTLVERKGSISYILEEGAIWVYASPNNNNRIPARFSFVVYKQ